MSTTTFIIDAFTDRAFSGNPAAVCLLEREVEESWLQAVAAEFNLSETAFLWPAGPGEWRLRWFTPDVEVDLCGHATLASAHVLWQECGETGQSLRFHTRSGVLTAARQQDKISLDFPADPPRPVPAPEGLAQALGAEPSFIGRGRFDLLVVLDEADALRRLAPDIQRLATVEARGIIVTARSDSRECDFISRFFAPRVGIAEDPVTGSAHCCLAPYWAARLGRPELRARQVSARGGALDVTVDDDRVRLAGGAVTVLKGSLLR